MTSESKMILILSEDKAANVETTLLFRERKLTAHVPAKLVNVHAYGVSLKPKDIADDILYTNVQSYMYGGIMGKMVIADSQISWYNIAAIYALPEGFMRLPRTGVHFRGKVPKDFEDMLARCGFEQKDEKRNKLFVGYPYKEVFQEIVDEKKNPYGPSFDTQVTPGTTNLRGIVTLTRTLKTFACFLDTYYHINSTSRAGLVNIIAGTEEDEPYKNAKVAELSYQSVVVPAWDFEAASTRVHTTAENMYLLVRPIPKLANRAHKGFGSVNECTITEGVIAPYFHGLNIYSTGVVEELMMSRFANTMGTTAELAMAEYSLYRRGWHSLASTEVGMAVQHMGYCIKIALEAKIGIYCIIEDSEYLGSVFYSFGADFAITIKGRVLRGEGGATFQNALHNLGGHRAAIKEIAAILSRVKLSDSDDDGETTRVVPVAKLKFARQLYREVQKREFGQADKELMKPLVEKLQFGFGYLPITPENLAWMVEVAAGESDYDVDTPMWIQGNSLYTHDIFRYACSAFGPTAPSFIMANGVVVKIPRIEVDDPTEEVNVKTNHKEMGFVAVVNKPLQIAAVELASVFQTKKIKVKYAPRGAGPAKNSYTCNGPTKKVVWDALRKSVHPVSTRASTKRKELEDRDDDERQEIAKKAKMDVDSAMNAF